ncbi:unnamed protein product [Diamesa tonsa]
MSSSPSSPGASSVLSTNQSSSESGILIDENWTLHYEMLSFVYENQTLSKSKLSFMWNQFKKICEVDKTADELKYIFNCTILPNITDYEQLDEDQRRYFNVVEVLDVDETEKILLNNEPQVGLDYKLIKENEEDSTDSELDDTHLEILIKDGLKDNKKYHGKFEEDLQRENDDYFLKIKQISPDEDILENEGEMEHELAVIFSAMLTSDDERKQGIKLLNQEQILSRLKTTRDLFARSSNYFNGSDDEITQQEPPCELVTCSDHNSSGISENSLPDIPANLSSSSDPEPLITPDTPANLSSSSDPEPLVPKEFEAYAVPKIKTKAALVPNPAHNPRMNLFTERFTSKKRPRRSSPSPPNSN